MLTEQEDMKKYIETRKVVKLVSDLREDHKRLEEKVEAVQSTASFYQKRFTQADQIVTAAKAGFVETPRFKPEFLRDSKYIDSIRTLIKKSVFARWNQEKKISTLLDIYRTVKVEINFLIDKGVWDTRRWKFPGKRTVDRRVNECADVRFWVDGVTPIIAIRGGLYIPNPYLFEDEVKLRLLELAERLSPKKR